MENLTERDLNIGNGRIIYTNPGKVDVIRVQTNDNRVLVVKKQYISNVDEVNVLMKEINAMSTLHHTNIIKVLATLVGGANGSIQYILIVLDDYPDGDLYKEIQQRMQNQNFWSQEELLQIFSQLISGFTYMQERELAHRDIKPQNILKKGNSYVISDLGCAFKSRKGESTSIAGTPAFLSPSLRYAYKVINEGRDIAHFNHNVYKSDVFSLGLSFLLMASLTSINDLGTLDGNYYNSLVNVRIIQLRYDEKVKSLLRNMLAFDENARMDFVQLANNLNIDYKIDASVIGSNTKREAVSAPLSLKNNTVVPIGNNFMQMGSAINLNPNPQSAGFIIVPPAQHGPAALQNKPFIQPPIPKNDVKVINKVQPSFQNIVSINALAYTQKLTDNLYARQIMEIPEIKQIKWKVKIAKPFQ